MLQSDVDAHIELLRPRPRHLAGTVLAVYSVWCAEVSEVARGLFLVRTHLPCIGEDVLIVEPDALLTGLGPRGDPDFSSATLLSKLSVLAVASACLLVGNMTSSSSYVSSLALKSTFFSTESLFICPFSFRGSLTGVPIVRRNPTMPFLSLPLKAPLILALQTGH